MMSVASPFIPCRTETETALVDLEDDALMAMARSGTRAAFEVLVRRHQRAVRNVCARLCSEAGMAEDLAQEVFVAVWRSRSTYEPRGQLLSYLLTTAINRSKNAVRGRRRRHETHDVAQAALNQPSPFDALNQSERRQRLLYYLTRLPDDQRRVIALKFGADLDYTQIGEIVGCPETTARTRAFAGLGTLRRLIGKRGSI